MISIPELPRLSESNHRECSPATPAYNCIAWAAGENARWWEPGRYWPIAADKLDFSPRTLVLAFQSIGFEVCPDGAVESGFEKIALYARGGEYTHAARQVPTGMWTSKLGAYLDIEHDAPDDVGGGVYGEVFAFMRRGSGPQSG
jgi:hypothetical protein